MSILKTVSTTVFSLALMGAVFSPARQGRRVEPENRDDLQRARGDSWSPPEGLGSVASRHLRVQNPGLAIRPSHRPDLQPGREDRLRHHSGDSELSPQGDRQDRNLRSESGRPASRKRSGHGSIPAETGAKNLFIRKPEQ